MSKTSRYSGKPFQCLLAVLLQVIEFCHCKFDMSWKKQSAEAGLAGLAGLTAREAALGTLWDETMVKKMPDPLGQILDLSCVKKEDLFMVVRFTVYIHNVITVHSTVYMYLLKESKQVSHNAITVHSIVYMYLLKESKQVSPNVVFIFCR